MTSFYETVEQARALLERNGRVSLAGLKREFGLDDEALGELVDELVEIQRVAVRDGRALAWDGPTTGTQTAPLSRAAAPERDPRDYTPKHLADKILRSKSALEGERKQVTVLFADVKGSMELSEQLDPEEWHSILERFFEILTEGVHRFEGTVNQYLGDGVMALFGAPIAHEDHAQRACWAALRIRDEVRAYADRLRVERGLNFGLRIGLNSGEVVVGKIGDDLRMDYTAQGHTVGLAQRMEQLADSGRVCLSAHTARLAEGYFELRDLGEARIKGVEQPLGIYELEGIGALRTRLDRSRARGFSRFVGRAREMETLDAALEHALAGNGQVLGVVGEAGVGKSRLCLEFVERCRTKGIPVHEAHCPAHGKSIPFLAILELLRDLFDIGERDGDRLAREKIAGRLLLLDREFAEVLPLVFDFLGVPDPERPAPRPDPEGRQHQLFTFARRLVRARSEREPAILLVDDLHWIDTGSDAFLAQIVDAVSDSPTLLVVNFRPEYEADWTRKPHYLQLPLLPLGPEDIEELLRHLLGTDSSIAEPLKHIRERTGGNPFFIEEVVQSLAESGQLEGARGAYVLKGQVEDVVVPASVQAVLAARIDRLAESGKQVLQTAAVIGKQFSEPLLEAVAGLPRPELVDALVTLREAEFIREEALYPVAEYAFKHPLTQAVALGSQLQDRRRRVHASVARAIERTAEPGRLGEQAALLAHHWEEAGDATEAARWHARAGEHIGVTNFAESGRHWQAVRRLTTGPTESKELVDLQLAACAQLLNLGWRIGMTEQEAADIYREGRQLADRSGNLRLLVLVVGSYSVFVGLAGDAEAYVRHSGEALEFAKRAGDDALRLDMQSLVMFARFSVGELFETRDIAARILADPAADAHSGSGISFNPYQSALLASAIVPLWLGQPEEARQALERVVELARETQEHEIFGWANVFLLGDLWHVSGRLVQGAERVRQITETAERSGSPALAVDACFCLGLLHVARGEWDSAIPELEETLSRIRGHQVGMVNQAAAGALLARAWLGRGDRDQARAAARAALRMRSRWEREIPALVYIAEVLRETDGVTVAQELHEILERASEVVKRTGARAYEPHLLEQRARLARVVGEQATFDQRLREAHRLYTEMGATGHVERLAKELDL